MLWIPCISRIFCGEPLYTSPENAPNRLKGAPWRTS